MESEEKANSLFPMFVPTRVHGLGRMAAESEQVDAGHDVEFRSLGVRSILNKSVSKRLKWMAWSINPYRGCEFGCRYCYARYTHEFLAPAVAAVRDGASRDAAEESSSCAAAGAVVRLGDSSAALRGLVAQEKAGASAVLRGSVDAFGVSEGNAGPSAALRSAQDDKFLGAGGEAGSSTSLRYGRNDKSLMRAQDDKSLGGEKAGSSAVLRGSVDDFGVSEGNAGPLRQAQGGLSAALRFAQDDKGLEVGVKAGSSTALRSGRNDKSLGGPKTDPSASLRDDRRAGLDPRADTVEGMDLRAPEAFERQIFVKSHAAWLLEQDLRRMVRQGHGDEEIALGTATDPWQPIERRARVTRSLLEVMASREGLRLGVVTKSTLIERDIDLLQEISRRSTLVVHITITTPDVELARLLEPRAPRPDLRFQTVRRLRAAGLRVGILNSPLLPGITDSPEAIDAMAARARQVDASFFAASPLFLKPCSRPTYFEFIREHFPHLQVLYAERFATMDFAARPYRERLRALVSASCRRYGLRERLTDELLTRDVGEEKKGAVAAWSTSAQGKLFA